MSVLLDGKRYDDMPSGLYTDGGTQLTSDDLRQRGRGVKMTISSSGSRRAHIQGDLDSVAWNVAW